MRYGVRAHGEGNGTSACIEEAPAFSDTSTAACAACAAEGCAARAAISTRKIRAALNRATVPAKAATRIAAAATCTPEATGREIRDDQHGGGAQNRSAGVVAEGTAVTAATLAPSTSLTAVSRSARPTAGIAEPIASVATEAIIVAAKDNANSPGSELAAAVAAASTDRPVGLEFHGRYRERDFAEVEQSAARAEPACRLGAARAAGAKPPDPSRRLFPTPALRRYRRYRRFLQ